MRHNPNPCIAPNCTTTEEPFTRSLELPTSFVTAPAAMSMQTGPAAVPAKESVTVKPGLEPVTTGVAESCDGADASTAEGESRVTCSEKVTSNAMLLLVGSGCPCARAIVAVGTSVIAARSAPRFVQSEV